MNILPLRSFLTALIVLVAVLDGRAQIPLAGDHDGDGLPNLAEVAHGMPQELFVPISPMIQGGIFSLKCEYSIKSIEGLDVELFASLDLAAWHRVATRNYLGGWVVEPNLPSPFAELTTRSEGGADYFDLGAPPSKSFWQLRYVNKRTVPFSAWSTVDIACWGDSLTAGDGGGGVSIASVLASLRGVSVSRHGYSGRWGSNIRSRFFLAQPVIERAALAMILSRGMEISGDTIIVHGREILAMESDFSSAICHRWVFDAASTSPASQDVVVPADAPAVGRWIKGGVVPIPPAYGESARLHIFWAGNNHPGELGVSDFYAPMIQHLRAFDRRYLILNLPVRTPWDWDLHAPKHDSPAVWLNHRTPANNKLAQLYPDHIFDVQSWLVNTYAALNADDETDQAQQMAPRSLKANRDDGDDRPADDTHFNALGYTKIAEAIDLWLSARGW